MRFLITAGGTREYIDPVRFISNASSGKMGYALSKAAIEAGHKVTLITASTMGQPPKEAKIIKAESAAQMFKAVKQQFPKCDCLIMAAAVSDYTPLRPSKIKIKKTDMDLVVKLKPTVDILKWAGKHKKKQIVIGFALEDSNVRTRAQGKLEEKNLDMIIANTPQAIGAEKSTVQVKRQDSQWIKIEDKPKAEIARRLIRLIEKEK